MVSLHKLVPQMLRLAELGRKLEADGKISVGYSDDYSTAALNFVLAEHGLSRSEKRSRRRAGQIGRQR